MEVFSMSYRELRSSRLVALAFCLALVSQVAVLGQNARTANSSGNGVNQDSEAAFGRDLRTFATGQKAKLKGSIVRRDADTFIVRDEQNLGSVVLLTDQTSVKSKGGFFKRGKNYDVTSLLSGLPVEVEGVGNRDGQLVANKVRFSSDDLKTARLVDTRVSPVEEANRRLSGQVDELGEASRLAHDRISSLDDYSIQASTTVYFKVDSSVISPEDRRALDDLAQKAVASKGYVIEVAGFADSTGDVNHNRMLSQRRADAVVRYLQENHEIPLRRIVTPFGYGELKPVADNTTAGGRRQNRRVEVNVLVSRGINTAGRVERND
jgi:outer membrane protein OmpA-like peptidoglycan-associated protein